jgi:hypothetical protein
MMGPADAAVLLAAAPVGGKVAAEAVAGEAETAGGKEKELADTKQAAAAGGLTEDIADSTTGGFASSGSAAGMAAAGCDASALAGSPVASARESVGSGCWALEDGCRCGCSTLPRLRRLEAEQVGGGAGLCSACSDFL